MKQILVKGLAIVALALAAVTPAKALTLGLDYAFSGFGIPGNPGPWGTAEFTDVAGGVQLKLTATGLTGGEFFSAWYFNLTPPKPPTGLQFTEVSNSDVSGYSYATGFNQFKADGDGFFDIVIEFAQSGAGRFGAGDSLTFLLTGIPGLKAEDFNTTSTGGPVAGFYTAAHFQATEGNGQSLWVADAPGDDGNTGGPVPEPSTYLVLASFIGMAVYLKRRMDKTTRFTVAH